MGATSSGDVAAQARDQPLEGAALVLRRLQGRLLGCHGALEAADGRRVLVDGGLQLLHRHRVGRHGALVPANVPGDHGVEERVLFLPVVDVLFQLRRPRRL